MQEALPRHLGGPVYEWSLPGPGMVHCVRPDGSVLTVDAFEDGGVWRARVAAYLTGAWQWRTESAHGRLDVPTPPAHSRWPAGPLRVSTDGQVLTYADGRPFFYLADTAWLIVRNGTPELLTRSPRELLEIG